MILGTIIQPVLVFPTDSLARSAEHYFITQKGGKSGWISLSSPYWLWWDCDSFCLRILWFAAQNIISLHKKEGNQAEYRYPTSNGFGEIATRVAYGFSGSQCRTLFHCVKRTEIRLNIVIQPVLALMRLRLVLPKKTLVRSAEHYFVA